MKVIFIGPYGFSGSTVLDVALSQSVDVVSGGELCYLGEWLEHDRLCTCSAPLSMCPAWAPVADSILSEKMAMLGSISRLRKLAAVIWPERHRELLRLYGEVYWEVADYLADWGGVEVVVDSSKDIFRLAALAITRPGQVEFLHLTRDLDSVVASAAVSKAMPAAGGSCRTSAVGGIKTMANWTVQNALSVVLSRQACLARTPVSYARLTQDPERVLRGICQAVGLQFSTSMLSLDTSSSHNISGSRWRFGSGSPAIQTGDDASSGRGLAMLCGAVGHARRWAERDRAKIAQSSQQ